MRFCGARIRSVWSWRRSASLSQRLDLPSRYCVPHHTQALSGCDWDRSYWAGGHIIIIGTLCGGRPRRSIPKPRPLTLHETAASLFYPILAWPSFADEIFRPISYSSWPFSYQSIFDQTFAEYPAKRVADLCPRQIGKSDATLRIGREIARTAAQQPLLQELGTALAQANGYLIKACPAEIPPLPVERLQLMDSQIDAMTMALEIVRAPLQKRPGLTYINEPIPPGGYLCSTARSLVPTPRTVLAGVEDLPILTPRTAALEGCLD
jgi:hypothetical protein